MKTCDICGKSFKNLGAHMKAHRSEDVQETQADEKENAKKRPKRPIERFAGNRVVFPGQVGMRVFRDRN